MYLLTPDTVDRPVFLAKQNYNNVKVLQIVCTS